MQKRTRAAIKWDDLRYFLAVAKTGSYLAAGRALGVDRTTVSRRVGVLERTMGCALLVPNDHGFHLTATGRSVQSRRIDLQDGVSTAGCDSVYLGPMSDARRKKLSTELIGRPVLVITEEDYECEIGSMFCLNVVDGHVSFRVNLDSVARSGIHIHPAVLQLGRRRGPSP